MRIEVYPGKVVTVDFDPDLTFECVDSCTWCCHHGVMLYESDFSALLDRESITDSVEPLFGREFITTIAQPDNEYADSEQRACYYLDSDGKCELHRTHDWKPTRCSVFPLEITVEDDELHVDIRDEARDHCEGLSVSDRRIIDHLDAFLPEVLWELDDPRTKVSLDKS